jgi:hypothetical protein
MKHYLNRLMNEVAPGDGGGAPAPTPTPTPAPTPTPSGVKLDWSQIREALPEDIRNDSSLSTINSLEGLVKTYVHSQKALGNKVPIPDKHATPEDWQQFFRKVGNPERIDDYKVSYKAPEGHEPNEEFINSIKEVAHKAGILPHQFESVVNAFLEKEAAIFGDLRSQQEAKAQEGVGALKKEWGSAYEDMMKKANVALKELLPEGDRAALEGWQQNPAMAKLLANAAKFFKEDVFVGHGEGKLAGLTPADALRRANEIMGDPNHPYRNTNHPNHRAAQKEVADLFAAAYPEA